MQNLSLKELRHITKNRNTNSYKSISKDKLLIIIIIINNNNNNNKEDRKIIFKSKKGLYKPARKNLIKAKIEEVKEILLDAIINRDEKIEEIKKVLYDPRNNLFKPEKEHYKTIEIGNTFSSNYIDHKSNGGKDKALPIKDYLMKLNHI